MPQPIDTKAAAPATPKTFEPEDGLPVGACSVNGRIRPLGAEGMCFEAFYDKWRKDGAPPGTGAQAYAAWRKGAAPIKAAE